MKRLLSLLTGIFSGFFLYGQSLIPTVLASSGDYFVNTNANFALAFTVGEMTMVETFTSTGNPQYILTQGFHQPEDRLTSVEDDLLVENFTVWPNPVRDQLNVRFVLNQAGEVRFRFFDVQGKALPASDVYRYTGGEASHLLDMSMFSQGLYFLEVQFIPTNGRATQIGHHKLTLIR